MRFASLVLSACVLTACGGGGGDSGAQLSASQAAYESVVLSPNAAYFAQSNLPLSGKPSSGTHYDYDQTRSISKSPLNNGAQLLTFGANTSITASLALPTTRFRRWVMVGGTAYDVEAQTVEIKYQGSDIVASTLTKDGAVLYTETSTLVTTSPLTGALASSADAITGFSPTLFTNTSLLKTGYNWQTGSLSLTVGLKMNADGYDIYADQSKGYVSLTPIANGTGKTIQQMIDSGDLTYSGVTYTLTNGTIKSGDSVNSGVRTYIANAPFFGDATSGFYRTFYERSDGVYAGQMQKSGATNVSTYYNAQARKSIVDALDF